VDQDDPRRPEQPLTDGRRADLVVGDHTSGVADQVRLAFGEAEGAVDVETGVHAAGTAICLDDDSSSGPLKDSA
jgi:hypothetical protein